MNVHDVATITVFSIVAAFAATMSEAQEITTHPPHVAGSEIVTIAEWTGRMTRLLDQQIGTPMVMASQQGRTGSVRIKFNCSDSGRTDKVTMEKGSGDPLLDRIAMRAVRNVASLHPLPTGFKTGQKYVALIVFARDAMDPMLKSSVLERTTRNAWYKDPEFASVPEPSGLSMASMERMETVH